MKKAHLALSHHLEDVSQLIFGCMGLGGDKHQNALTKADEKHAQAAVETALEGGINLFDHADIYANGKAERVFGQLLQHSPHLKDQVYLQSKCGIRFADEFGPKRYDFSAKWVTQSVEGILSRLKVDKIDVLLLHRPDPLVEFDELCDAILRLQTSGKITHIGVSNMHQAQMKQLSSRLASPIVANQLQMSLSHLDFLKQSVSLPYAADQCAPGTLAYCDTHHVQIQAWGSLAQGRFTRVDEKAKDPTTQDLIDYIQTLAREYQIACEAIVLAFLTRLPQGIQPVIGTTNPDRIKACLEVNKVSLSREHWYGLLEKALGQPLP